MVAENRTLIERSTIGFLSWWHYTLQSIEPLFARQDGHTINVIH